jgi:HEAT repeat protein
MQQPADTTADTAAEQRARHLAAKLALLREHQHLIPNYLRIAEIGKARGIWSKHTVASQAAYPLRLLARRHGLDTATPQPTSPDVETATRFLVVLLRHYKSIVRSIAGKALLALPDRAAAKALVAHLLDCSDDMVAAIAAEVITLLSRELTPA